MYYPAQKAVCDDSPVRAWDQAVAFYAGSLEGESGVGEGLLVFDLADKMCARFLTCGDKAELRFGVSYVNNMIINRFMDGQKHLLKRECDAARKAKNEISKIMAVPLVQATLLNTYEQIYGKERTPEEDAQLEMQGSAYAATLLPLIHDCSPDDAQYIHGSLRFDRGEGNETWMPNYVAIKKVFERNYKCMGITCKAVGGIWEGREYSPYAGPCQDAVEVEEKSLGDNLRIALAVVGVGIALVTIAACCFAYERYKEGRERMYYHDREPSHIPVGNLHASREFD